MRRPAVAFALVLAATSCGGSSSGTPTVPPASATTSTAATFRADVVRLWTPLKYADASKMSADTLAAKFDGFAAAVEAEAVPSVEVAARASIASAARHGAEQLRSTTNAVGVGGALGAAQGTIDGHIAALPR
jgi:hypothetical protein